MTPDPPLARLAELRSAYLAMQLTELRVIWDSRESSELGADELRAILFAIREKMGLPTNKETSAELDGHTAGKLRYATPAAAGLPPHCESSAVIADNC